MNKKLLSIVVPAYNMEKYLDKCLSSVLIDAELLDLLEVIVVNDGSKDRTSDIAHDFERRYPSVFRVIDKENGHYGSCINIGIKDASGKYWRVLDADDSVDTREFEAFVKEILEDHNEYDVLITDYATVNSDGGMLSRKKIDCFHGDSLAMCAETYSLDLLRRIDYHQQEGIAYTDTECAIIPFAHAKKIKLFDYCIYRYLIGREDQSVAPVVAARGVKQLVKVVERLIEYRNDNSGSINPERSDIFDRMIANTVSMVYRLMLLKCSYREMKQDITEFDIFVRQNHAISYVKMNEFCCPKKLRFHPISFWRRHPEISRIVMPMLNFYTKVVAK